VKAGTAVVSSTPQGALPPGAIQISYPLAQAFGVRFAIVKEIKPAAPKGGGPVVITIVFEEVQQAKQQQAMMMLQAGQAGAGIQKDSAQANKANSEARNVG